MSKYVATRLGVSSKALLYAVMSAVRPFALHGYLLPDQAEITLIEKIHSPSEGTDKLTSTSGRNPADLRLTEPLRFSKTQEPVAGNIDNDWPTSDADPS